MVGKHDGTLVCHLLQDLKVPYSNLDKDRQFIKLEMIQDLGDSKSMSPVSPVFQTVVIVSIDLKNVLRVGTSIP